MAITNSLVGNVCYPTVSSATDAFFSSLPVSIITSSASTFRLLHLKVGSQWKQNKVVYNSTGLETQIYTVDITAPTFPPCDPTQSYFDGMQIGWGIVAAMIAVYAVILIRKAFFQ